MISFTIKSNRGEGKKNEYSIAKDDIILATVFFKPFFINLVGPDDKDKDDFAKCYKADLRDLKECFHLVFNNKRMIEKTVTTI